MNGLNRQLLGLGLSVAGSVMLISPVRRDRAVWHVTVGAKPPGLRVLHGGGYVPAARVTLRALRYGHRRPDAQFRSAVGLALIGSGLALSLTRGDP